MIIALKAIVVPGATHRVWMDLLEHLHSKWASSQQPDFVHGHFYDVLLANLSSLCASASFIVKGKYAAKHC